MAPQMDAATVGRRLGLGADDRAWLEDLAATAPTAPPATLPAAADVAAPLERLGVAEADAADLAGAWPDRLARPVTA